MKETSAKLLDKMTGAMVITRNPVAVIGGTRNVNSVLDCVLDKTYVESRFAIVPPTSMLKSAGR